jgi:6-phosphofructokinase 2
MPGAQLLPEEQRQFIETLRSLTPEIIVVSGSMPPGVEATFLQDVAQTAREAHSRLIIDTSGAALQQAVEEEVFLIKPNLGELSKLAGVETLDSESAAKAAQVIIAKGKCEVIVISMGHGEPAWSPKI